MTEYVAVGNDVFEQMTYDGTNASAINGWLSDDVEAIVGSSGKLYTIEAGYSEIIRSYSVGQTVVGRITYGPTPIDGTAAERYVRPADGVPFGYRLVERSQIPGDDGTTQTMASTA